MLRTPTNGQILALILCGAISACPTEAAVITTGTTVTDSFSSWQSGGIQYVSPTSTFTLHVNPFNTALGTLTSVTITGSSSGSFSGVADPYGYAEMNPKSLVKINGSTNYPGPSWYSVKADATADSSGGALSFTLSPFYFTHTFAAWPPGNGYDPALWTVLAGSSSYDVTAPLALSSGNYGSYNGITSGTMSLVTHMSLSYDYVAAPTVPEIDPSSLGSVLALLFGSLGLVERRTRRVLGLA